MHFASTLMVVPLSVLDDTIIIGSDIGSAAPRPSAGSGAGPKHSTTLVVAFTIVPVTPQEEHRLA